MSEKQNLTEFNSFDTEKKVGPLKKQDVSADTST